MKPNIIYILADDMGYGDLGANNPESKIPTPNLDRLAAGGMRFTNAHSGTSVCTPSRYNVLTGRYCWRSKLKTGIVWEWDDALIEPVRLTVAELLRRNGYHTACLGKWHLGWNWPRKEGSKPWPEREPGERRPLEERLVCEQDVDFTARIGGGPVDNGFDTYFGVDVPNFPPYTWFEDDHVSEVPTVPKPPVKEMYGEDGLMVPDWKLEPMIPEFTRRAVKLIEEQAGRPEGERKPYFLYFPLTSPHSPVVPNREFIGKSGAGPYGDFVCEVDWIVGEVMNALERTGTANDTLIIFTSDNGPESRTFDEIGCYTRIRDYGHYSMGNLRGIKRDAWEGGHREPFVARWPDVIPAGSVCDQVTVLGDLLATCADIVGTRVPEGAGEDSVSILPLLKGQTDKPVRECAVHHSMNGRFAIQKDNWVFIDSPTGDDNKEPEWHRKNRGYEPHDCPGELYDLSKDLSERTNLYRERPEIVRELSALLAEVKGDEAPSGKDAAQSGDFPA
ncbi:MAG: arylsulfatase [Kiritimatiellia bacterium]